MICVPTVARSESTKWSASDTSYHTREIYFDCIVGRGESSVGLDRPAVSVVFLSNLGKGSRSREEQAEMKHGDDDCVVLYEQIPYE